MTLGNCFWILTVPNGVDTNANLNQLIFNVSRSAFLELIFSITDSIFNGTQAFANPTDLASSGVWKMFPLARHLVLMVSEEKYSS